VTAKSSKNGRTSTAATSRTKATKPSVADARAAEQALARQRKQTEQARIAETFGGEVVGRGFVVVDLAVTAIVVVASALGIADYRGLAFTAASVDLAVFAVGFVVFCAALWAGAQRSREAEMDIAAWFFLSRVAPPQVRRPMLGALAVQAVVGLGAAIATTGEARSAGDQATKLAFGVLVPIFGLALNGLWSARHGAFPPRVEVAARVRRQRPTRGGRGGSTR
jgi:hypothetical protein